MDKIEPIDAPSDLTTHYERLIWSQAWNEAVDMMTRKDYQAIADTMVAARRELATANLEAPDTDTQYALDTVIDLLAATLTADNPRFDYDRFVKACGYMARLADVT